LRETGFGLRRNVDLDRLETATGIGRLQRLARRLDIVRRPVGTEERRDDFLDLPRLQQLGPRHVDRVDQEFRGRGHGLRRWRFLGSESRGRPRGKQRNADSRATARFDAPQPLDNHEKMKPPTRPDCLSNRRGE